MVVAIAVGHSEPIIEKSHVEPAGLEHTRDFLIVVRCHGIIARLWMTPGTREVGAVLRLQEPHHHLLPRHVMFSIIGVSTRPQARRPGPSAHELSGSSCVKPYCSARARNFAHVASSTSMPDFR